jgi:hypothetical protein
VVGNLEVVLLEQRDVDPHHRGGGVEGQRQHVAIGIGVVGDHGRNVVGLVERHALVFHQLVTG